MKGSNLIIGILLTLAIICVVNGQYFSSSDGVNLPRSGKRSYLTSLLKDQDLQASTPKSTESSVVNIDGPSYYQTDKLSFTRLFNKLGKRAENYYYNQPSQDYLTKEALINYLYSQLHKLDHRSRDYSVAIDDDSSSSSDSVENN